VFERNEDDPLEAEAIIVDEASMIDLELMHHLLRAIPLEATLILVGDVFQLPSVGPGNVLADMIASECIPSFRLTHIYRQAGESPIVTNAHRVRRGRLPVDRQVPAGGFIFIEENDPRQAVRTVVTLCREELPARWGLDPVRDIQVLTPMHRGEVGTVQLNQALQSALNPHAGQTEEAGGDLRFRLQDKVMHLRNNYPKEVFNGDIGRVMRIEAETRRLWVDYEDRVVPYDFDELDELSLAYAISVHKSQGSEYPVVVLPLFTQHYPLLQRNLLYTAITRARRQVAVVGMQRALEIAVANDRPHQRHTYLAKRLTGR
jgi:exodeoxyribonuclease V alpha subunit